MPDAATIAAAFPSCPDCGTQLERVFERDAVSRALSIRGAWRCPNVARTHNVRTWSWVDFGDYLQRVGQHDAVPA